MGCDCFRDLFRFLDLKKVTNDLSVMSRLPGKALYGIALRQNLGLRHHLDLLRRLRNGAEGIRLAWYGTVH